MLSYWEKTSLLQYDYIIVGSGIVGLSTAISIKEADENARVLVLEREVLPTGASTKNAGFACIGSLTEILSDLQTMSEAEVLQLVQMRYEGLQLLRQRLGDNAIGYTENGSYELITTHDEWALDKIDQVNSLLGHFFPQQPFSVASGKLSEFGFDRQTVKAIISNNYEGELHTGKMMRSLIDLTFRLGVEVKTGAVVTRVEDLQHSVNVVVPHHLLQEDIIFSARKLIVCTNAFTKELLQDQGDTVPGRGQVLITEPIPGLPFKGIFHFEEGFYYFRELEGRVLFGGGRQLDFAGESTTSFAYNDRIQHELENILRKIILPNHPFTIADRWTGIMAFGKTKQPIIRHHSPNIILGVRMGGMGVAIGSKVGAQLADLALK
ncbi:glycine/D-amino acid oxidase-like deaminating enzyme [Chitinophaga dinghuensis]|uniref:Glycine/D-amino acid oxidase-like deaminating enzyme n=1 Tax=Chitinophaga dinghuensis TaxID=1539050 RepID=A0A327WC26_9BACT|nr:FAD-dependent oxidoreductase [Chitinophaga dinghuensis]RAJ87749.1 glycine/D-amino acid oxidase-like deaminating enzyme [Chitinophaga dinghuensis]